MGKVLSIFRRNPSSEEILTKLEEQIKDLEGYTVSTRETQRKVAGRFLVASIGTYVIAFAVFYFYFFPPTWRERLIYSLPMLLFPVLIILLKYAVSWYFNSKIDRNNRRLIQLRNEKKKVLQNVMDKETYKVALEILSTFGDKSVQMKARHDLDSSMSLNASINSSSVGQLTHRTPIRPANPQSNRLLGPSNTPAGPLNNAMTPFNRGTPAPIGFRAGVQPNTPAIIRNGGTTPGIPALNFNTQKRPFPVIDTRKQNVMEKMMDFIISDGPSNRFAMICSGCCGHNGMALQEDFEYVAFKCAFCGHLNPARKIRPKARELSTERKPVQGSEQQQRQQQNSNQMLKPALVDDSTSSSEEEELVVKKPLVTIQTQGPREINLDSSDDSEEEDEEDKPVLVDKEEEGMDVDDVGEVKEAEDKKKD